MKEVQGTQDLRFRIYKLVMEFWVNRSFLDVAIGAGEGLQFWP